MGLHARTRRRLLDLLTFANRVLFGWPRLRRGLVGLAGIVPGLRPRIRRVLVPGHSVPASLAASAVGSQWPLSRRARFVQDQLDRSLNQKFAGSS